MYIFPFYTVIFAIQIYSSFFSQHKMLIGSMGCGVVSWQCELSGLFNIQFTLSLCFFVFLFGDFGVRAGSDLHCAGSLALLAFSPYFPAKYR